VSVAEIPVAHTPEGGYGTTMPPPILAGCDEPLIAGAPDLRGTWQVVEVTHEGVVQPAHRALGSIQRVEQAGDRIVICGGGVVHDMRCDGTEEHGVNDVAEMDKTTRITVVATYEDGAHVLRPKGIPIEVVRRRDGEHMVWDYVGFTARLELITAVEL
jgi:hypothetical protein